MKKLIAASALALVSTQSFAVGMSDPKEFCVGSIEYAMDYAPETSAKKLHEAELDILTSENVNSAQKLLSVILFQLTQAWAYTQTSEVTQEDVDEWFEAMMVFCMKQSAKHTPNDLSEMEEDNSSIF